MAYKDASIFIKKVQAVGFEPTPLSRLAPKASALTTRPNLLCGGWNKKSIRGGIRTRDLLLRRETRYPLRYTDKPFEVEEKCVGFATDVQSWPSG
jgi:hypothetical protein